MARKVVQVAMNGVTGRMGYRQHLVRSLLAIREQGGVPLADGTLVCPEPVLVGRREARLREIAEQHGIERWTTSLDEVLSDPGIDIYFDTQVTSAREAGAGEGHRGGQARVHREAGGRLAGRRGEAGPGGPRGRDHPRRGPGQAVPARDDQTAAADQGGLLRPGAVDPAGVRLLGVRGRRTGRAAPVLELPQGGRRRHRPGHVPALAVPAGGPVRADPGAVRAAGHAPAGALGRDRHQVRRDRR